MATKKHKRHKLFGSGILCFLCLFVALSFFTTLVPVAGASAGKANAMPCCVGKAEGHCESGVAAKKPPQPKEPMCGLHNDSEENDGITIVAEPTHTESHSSFSRTAETISRAAESASLSQPCRMDCGACLASSTQQRRERGIVLSTTSQTPLPSTFSNFENSSALFSLNEDWEQSSPRGPPSDLL